MLWLPPPGTLFRRYHRAHSQTFLRSLLNVPSSVQPALTPPNENSTHTRIQTLPTLSSCLIFLHSTHLFIYFFIVCLPPDRGLQEGEPSKNYPLNERMSRKLLLEISSTWPLALGRTIHGSQIPCPGGWHRKGRASARA